MQAVDARRKRIVGATEGPTDVPGQTAAESLAELTRWLAKPPPPRVHK